MSADNNRRIENLIRFGVIAEVDHKAAKARVKSGQILTDFLPFLTLRTGTTRTWSPPTVGEQCVVLAMSGELTTAAILTGLYTQNSPSHSEDEHTIIFADGAEIKYNQKSHELTVTGIHTAHITAQTSVTAETPKVICSRDLEIGGDVLIHGNMQITGNVDCSADVVASGVSLVSHTHPGDSGGSTGAPS